MTGPLVLVACCSPKLSHAAPARDLYTGDLFRKSRAYAEALDADWLILSAKHGVVEPDRVLEPYDQRPPGDRAGRLGFARQCAFGLQAHRAREIIVLAGEAYCGWIHVMNDSRFVDGKWTTVYVHFPRVTRPLEGKGIGQQKAWLKAKLSKLALMQQRIAE